MFGQRAGRALGALAFDSLAISRGETITKKPLSQPHHRECPTCGFDRWDGYSEHRWGGGRFAQRTCYGPTPDKVAPATPMNPLVSELMGYATGEGEELEPESLEAPVDDPAHGFTILGDARDH